VRADLREQERDPAVARWPGLFGIAFVRHYLQDTDVL
jgi:hypothetical protein